MRNHKKEFHRIGRAEATARAMRGGQHMIEESSISALCRPELQIMLRRAALML
jgi:hypothetical protein